jgi:mgtE-like transporter
MRGNIFASLGSRFGTYLHTGQISPNFRRAKILDQNVISSFILTMLMSTYLGFLASLLAKFVGLEVRMIDLVLISIFGGIFSAFLMLAITILIAFLSYRRGWDPDNMTSPLITLFGDMLTLPLLFLSMSLIMLMPHNLKIGFFIMLILLTIFSIFISFEDACRPYCKRIIIESIPMFLFCGLLSTFSGSILGSKFVGLISIAGIFTMIPAFLEDGGAIGGILAARFSSSLHMGTMEYGKKISKEALKLFSFMHLLGLIIFPLIAIFAFIINKIIGLITPSINEMIFISLLTGEILILIVNLVAYYSSALSFKFGLDPDNIVIPLITSLMDVIGTGCLVATIILLGII